MSQQGGWDGVSDDGGEKMSQDPNDSEAEKWPRSWSQSHGQDNEVLVDQIGFVHEILLARGDMTRLLVVVTILMIVGVSLVEADDNTDQDPVSYDGFQPHIMLWVEYDECKYETTECRRNDGPCPLISFYTSELDPSMQVKIFMDGKLLQTTREHSNTISMIMRSPHEFADFERRTGPMHLVVGRVEDGGGKVVAEDRLEFSYDLTNNALKDLKSFWASCPVCLSSLPLPMLTAGLRCSTAAMSNLTIEVETAMALISLLSSSVWDSSAPQCCTNFASVMAGEMAVSYSSAHDGGGRRLVSLDTDKEWVSKFEHFKSDFHEIYHVQAEHRDVGGSWGVAFIDQHPESSRIEVARRIKDRTKYIVMHDAYRQLGQKVP
eukprot:758811-Hanusia_phi.AAC.4